MTDFEFRNTGLDSIYADEGRARITLSQSDVGKFKTPSLRNITVTAPYMHDGRFATLMECIDHYNTGFHYHPNLDPLLAAMKELISAVRTETGKVFLDGEAVGKVMAMNNYQTGKTGR
jgi:cytochrome c peroxidase